MIVSSVCARGGSRGVPGKALRELGGRSLLERAVGDALTSRVCEAVAVSSDDPRYLDVARSAGAHFTVERPAEFATDGASKWLVFRHLVEAFERARGCEVSILVDLDVGTPFRRMDDVEACVRALRADPATGCVTTGYEPERNPYFNMVEVAADGFARIVAGEGARPVARQAAPRVLGLTPVCFAARRAALFEADHWSAVPLRVVEVARESALDIDSEYDFTLATLLWNHRERDGRAG